LSRLARALWLCAAFLAGCADSPAGPGTDAGSGAADMALVADGSALDASNDDTGIAMDAQVGATQCTNGLDDDGDGLVDALDPECTGSADNDEGTFGTGIPGDNRDPMWQDCFFSTATPERATMAVAIEPAASRASCRRAIRIAL
jgi:hypothetical protein